MSEIPSDNVPDTQIQHQQQRPEAVVLSNGTTLVASAADVEAESRGAADNEETAEQPKGDLTKILIGDGQEVKISSEDTNAAPAPDASHDHDDEQPSHTTAAPSSDAQPSLASPIVRAATPSSRTSTPPLGANAQARKKFSSVNVNQKFLSKAASPAPAAGQQKISSLNASSPVPIASTSSRLLSTKLTTVPSNKSSASPIPAGSTSASSSPWAKPVLPLPVAPIIEPETPAPAPAASTPTTSTTTTTLHQPAPMRARVLGTTTTPPVMGAGLGIAAPTSKPAWKAVSGEPRKPASGITRDFPTAMEVAEGKKAAQLAAQAQAAHNQAILQGLNAFTQLDPNAHRWDEEDEEDDVIDFGDGSGEHSHEGAQVDGLGDRPVAKSDRFAEDFDRSWPRRPPPQQDFDRGDRENRTLFNASSNRLESRQPPQVLQVQPTRLMSRPTEPPRPAVGFDRPLPPHLQGRPPAAAEGTGRMLPPHMAGNGPQPQAAPPTARSAWGGINRNVDRAPPPHLSSDRPALPPQSAAKSPENTLSSLPPRRSFSHAGPPPPVPPDAHPPPVGADEQAAEMHTAAEKARLRRLAEESEREAAAERARQKARELEERFSKTVRSPDVAPPPPQSKPAQASSASSHLPPRPELHDRLPQPSTQPPPRSAETSWRNRMQPQPESVHEPQPTTAPTPRDNASNHTRPSRPTAESFFETTPGEPSTFALPHDGANFDSMLARIQAAMAEARSSEETPIMPSPERPIARPTLSPLPVQEYFDVTYPEPPRSPPPAWRSYHIRIPKAQPGRRLTPAPRLRAAEAPRLASPAGFFSTFTAPTGTSLTRAELLLPQPVLRRFQRSEPVVSISPRRLEPFEKKPKKKPVASNLPGVSHVSPVESSTLLSADPLKSQQLRDQRARADGWRQAESSTTVANHPPVAETPLEAPPRKIKSPVKTSAAARAEREGRFATDGVTIGAPGGAFADKPGVRFMVSSELEGDSLLDEVNKMSLESVGEGDDKEQDVQSGESVKLSGAETPKTPPVPRPSSPNTSSWPKVPLSYPASHSPARSSQHDAIKSVWEAQQTTDESSNVNTPMYPSLNAPSSSDPPAMSFSNSQTFSSPGGSGPALPPINVHRAPSAPSPYGHYASPQTMSSPDVQSHHNVMGLSYSNMGNARAGSTNGFQQGVWSPTAFGTSMASPGYPAYAAQQQQKPSMDPKSPSTMAYNGKATDGMAYGGYQQATHHPQQQYSGANYGRGVTNPANMSAYGYGAPGQQARPVSGRFAAQPNGGEYAPQAQVGYMGAEAGQGGYYGGVAQNQPTYPVANYQYQQQPQAHGAVGQGGRGGMGAHGVVRQDHGMSGSMGGARKMW
ncbi:hypothetical protein IAT40_000447 [Kwoniella sp. CBS 6097]